MESKLLDGHQITIISDWFKFKLAYNDGAAFSFGKSKPIIILMLSVAISVGLLIYLRKVNSRVWLLAFGLVLGGAFGNLFDRFFGSSQFLYGSVVDYISVGNFPIFNLADSCITIGAFLMYVLIIKKISIF